MRQHLTSESIKRLPNPSTGNAKYWDKVQPGFGIRCTSRSKSYFVVYGINRQLHTIGKFEQISLSEARKVARQYLDHIPAKTRLETLSEAREAFLSDCEKRLRQPTVTQYRLYLSKIDKKLLSDIKRTDIDISHPHTVASWKAFFNWCIRTGLTDTNPFNHIPVSYTQRSRVLTDAEIKAVWQYEYPPFSDIVKLCLLTGQRKGEVTQFASSWIDGDTITIPAHVAKNKPEHTIPFNLLTARYLKRYQNQTYNGFSKAKKRLDDHVPLPHWTIHDLRRTYATIHARIGTPIHVVEALLNHKSGVISGVAAIYIQHNFLAEARKAQLAYESYIYKIIRK